MDAVAFYPAALALVVMLGLTGARAVLARSLAGRILALDTAVLLLIGLLVLYSYWRAVPYFFDAALILALLGFIGTLAAARFYGEGRLF